MRPVTSVIENPIPFLEDRRHAAYDAEQVNRFFRVLAQADRITKRFQGRFLGKTSPVHFFWGALDLALTRFTGRRAPQPKESAGGVHRASRAHEDISDGLLPGR